MKKLQLLFVLPLLMSLVSCNTTDSTTKISFKEYVEIVNNQQEGDKDIFILTSSSCAHCQKIKPLINKYINEKGKIMPRRMTGACAKHQRHIAQQIKWARYMALLPYVK